jgi:hypothetical protein
MIRLNKTFLMEDFIQMIDPQDRVTLISGLLSTLRGCDLLRIEAETIELYRNQKEKEAHELLEKINNEE